MKKKILYLQYDWLQSKLSGKWIES